MAPNSSTLKTLHLLMTQETKNASLALNDVLQRQRSMQQILTTLHRDHIRHARQVEKLRQHPVAASQWRNYQNYLEHLEIGIGHQVKGLAKASGEKEQSQASLRQRRSQQRAVEQLMYRQTQAKQNLMLRLEERTSDDRSAHACKSTQLRLSARS